MPVLDLWKLATVTVWLPGKFAFGDNCTTYSTTPGYVGFTTELNEKGIGCVITAFSPGETSPGRAYGVARPCAAVLTETK